MIGPDIEGKRNCRENLQSKQYEANRVPPVVLVSEDRTLTLESMRIEGVVSSLLYVENLRRPHPCLYWGALFIIP